MGNSIQKCWQLSDNFCDYLSYNYCLEKPTVYLVIINMDIPAPEKHALEIIANAFYDIIGILSLPLKMLNDKKFSVHGYESSNVFVNNNATKTNDIDFYEIILIFISKHSNKIAEPAAKRMLKNIMINKKDYDVPISTWLTFIMDNNKKIYFYIHISAIKGYKGILFAALNEDNTLLATIKKDATEYYMTTLGNSSDSESDETIGDL